LHTELLLVFVTHRLAITDVRGC